MRLYLDTCCFNRPFDERNNMQSYLEREAVLSILELALSNSDVEIVASEALDIEIHGIKDEHRREAVKALVSYSQSRYVEIDDSSISRSREIMALSKIRMFDTLHLALAEGNADFLITVDKRLIKMASRLNLKCAIKNPIDFLQGVFSGEYDN